MNIKIGSRKSALAVKQTEAVIKKLQTLFPHDSFEIVGISTIGDKRLDKNLQSFGGKGVFVKEIEAALLCGEIDMAVHSAKDMPVEIPNGLEISAALLRTDRRDALVYFDKKENIKIIGTGSARREAQAEKLFPNIIFKPIRGNIYTRLEKVKNGEYDAVIMAKAALSRLEITDAQIMDLPDAFICAAGQGIIAVETIKGEMKKYTDAVNDKAVMAELTAERAFLERIGGGCSAPCGASAVYHGGKVTMKTFYRKDKEDIYLEMTGSNPALLGREMAKRTITEEK